MRLPEPLGSRYDVLEQIGSGGEAVVYRALDREGRECALKIYHEQGAADRRVWDRLESLTHRALMHIKPTGQLSDGRDYEVMPYLPWRSLQGQGPMPQSELFAVVCELIGGINQLHTVDIVHRDLKPSNILYDPATQAVKITDFGISRAPLQQTRIAYTVGYAPPEAHDQIITPAWDWWSLGAIVYELATGAVLFGGRSPTEIKALVRAGEITHLDKLPPRWRALCTGLLVADRDRRWGSSETLAWMHGEEAPVLKPVGAGLPDTVRDPVSVRPAPVSPKPVTAPPRPKAEPAGQSGTGGFAYEGKRYRSAQDLAATLARRPKRAVEEFFGLPAADATARLRALATWAGKSLPPHIASGTEEPIVRLNHLLYWLDPMSPPVLEAGPLRPATLVRLCARAGEAVADASDRRAMAVIRSGNLLAHWKHCPGFEALKQVHRAWRSALGEWERAVTEQSPHVRRLLEPSQSVVEALMLLALLPYPGAETAVRQRAQSQSAPAGTAVPWYDALVLRFGGRDSAMGMVVRAVCGPVALAAAHENALAEKAAAVEPEPKAQPHTQPKAQPKAQTQPVSVPFLDFHGRHRTGAELARALRTHHDEAMRVFLRAPGAPRAGELAAWLRTLKESPKGRVDSLDSLRQRLTGGAATDVKLLYLLRWLDPGGAALYGGRNVTVQGVIDACVPVLDRKGETKAHPFVRALAAPLALDALGGFPALAALGPAGEKQVKFQRTLWRVLGRHGVTPVERTDQVFAAGLLLGLDTDHAWRRLSEAAGKEVAKPGPRSAWFAPVLADLGGHGSRQGAAVEAALLPLARRQAAAQAKAADAKKSKSAQTAKTAQPTKAAQAAKTAKTAKSAAQPKPAPSKPAPSKPAPSKPAPSKPAPSKPAPSKPAPSKSKSTQSKSTQSKSTQSRPAQPKAPQPKTKKTPVKATQTKTQTKKPQAAPNAQKKPPKVSYSRWSRTQVPNWPSSRTG
ncbi:protein kinase [Streptomyces sp. NPDC007905]|uniref:serine/threonine-protein kinase n=1 Tax=Streptomyces sp. NPDC007905 TaxID=3364788 RepID=UPI0036E34C6A